MPLIAVAPNRHAFGVDGPSDDWRSEPGSDRNCRSIERDGRIKQVGIRSPYVVTDLTRALEAEYRTDAHFVPYVLRDPRGTPALVQPRLNKQGLAFVRSLGWSVTIEVLVADIDNPGHVPWTDELREIAREIDRRVPSVGIYYSAHGRRYTGLLSRPVVVDEYETAERIQAAWLRSLIALGVHPDEGCQDWTRHYRLPHVRRDGAFKRAEFIDLSRMAPIDPPEPAPLIGRRKAPSGRIELARAEDVDASPIAGQLEAGGWLGPHLGRGKRSLRCPFAASHSSGRDFDSSTVLFGPTIKCPLGFVHCSHAHCVGRSQNEFFAALGVDLSTPRPSPKRRRLVTREVAAATLVTAFREAGAELSVVIAGCGTGKTEAAIAVAAERAEREHASPKAIGDRAPLHSQTAISVPTTKLAIEVAERARSKGVEVRRLFGPLSMRRPDGSPECQIHECASAFSRGGLSVPWELCEGRGREPCQHADTCQARSGVDGPESARVVVGPHRLLSRLSASVGKTGLLVIDEPPPLLSHEVLTVEDLLECARVLSMHFEHRYASALSVSLHALAAWVSTGPLDKPGPLASGVALADSERLAAAMAATGAETAVEAARRAHEPAPEGSRAARSTSPPVRRESAYAARHHLAVARVIGEASRVARIVWTALACDPGGAVARIEERAGSRVLVVTLPDVGFRESVRREGPTVIADAGGAEHLDIYRLIVGYQPKSIEVFAEETSTVERVHIARRASRAGWFDHGRLVVDHSLVRSLELAFAWLAEDRDTWAAALVTFRPVELAIRAARGEDVLAAWLEAGQTESALADAVKRLSRVVSSARCPLELGHYGALRGLDRWKDHDALITLGDPWGQLGDARHEGELLGLRSWEARLEAAAAGELEQAHGRLRTVHRTCPARALHVGIVVPGGWEPGGYETRSDKGGKPKKIDIAEARRLVKTKGVAEAARELGVHRVTLYRAI